MHRFWRALNAMFEGGRPGLVAGFFGPLTPSAPAKTSYPEQVALIDLAAAAGLTMLEVDGSQPEFRRGPVDIEPAIRDFGFAPKIDHREGIKRMIAARHETITPRLPG